MKNLFLAMLFIFTFAFNVEATGAIIPDKAAPGTTTNGIQEAIDLANSQGGGLIQLVCQETYTLTPKQGVWIDMIDKSNITIRGCGRESSIIEAIGDFGAFDYSVFSIGRTSRMIMFEDLKIHIHNTCSSGDCNQADAFDEMFNIWGTPNHIDFHNVNLEMISNDSPAITDPASSRMIHIACDAKGSDPDIAGCWDFSVKDSRLVISDRGVECLLCNNLDVINNHFESSMDPSIQPASSMIIKYIGPGVRIIGNQFDMKYDSIHYGTQWHRGVFLRNSGHTNKPGKSAQIIGNTFYNLQNVASKDAGIALFGYDGATISGNQFNCENEAATACVGINFDRETDCVNCNQGNTIIYNTFQFPGPGDGGPILFKDSQNGVDSNCGNIITNNVMFLSSNTDDGFRGDGIKKACNTVTNNMTIAPDKSFSSHNNAGMP